ncbi:hypothetical protein EI94DRAFT_1538507, partial [Lactarius quietus]
VSPYRDQFTSYTPIESLAITAANLTNFDAVGRGTIELNLLNGEETTRMIFRNVLHCPKVGFTLISTTLMDRIGYGIGQKNCRL